MDENYQYHDLVEYRGDPNGNDIERLQQWMWPKTDVGLWEGPMREWISDHSKKWFKKVQKFDVVVQAGGACGMYPRLLADKFAMVYTFEPIALNFHCLVNNCQSKKIIKINAALGDKPGMCGINQGSDGNMGSHGMFNSHNDTLVDGPIPVMTIDNLALPACDLIALDVECFEPQVLTGAIETIQKFHPVITCELGERPPITEFMTKYGYVVQDRSAMDMVYCYNPK
jgi:FkbM family methyltransferase